MTEGGHLRIGIVGCGRAGEQLHLPALAKIRDAEVTALADVDPARLTRVAEQFGIARRFDDWRHLVSEAAVDIVGVCAPADQHEAITVAALAAGKHVYVEKPLALNERAAAAMVEAAAAGPGRATVGLNLRSHRLVGQARRIIASGTLGKIELLQTSWSAGSNLGARWPESRDQRATGGGVLFEMATHHTDLWRYLLDDEVDNVFAAASYRGGVEDMSATVTAQMRGGVLVSGVYSQASSDCNDVAVYGQAGILRFSCYRADSLSFQPTSALGGGARARLRELGRSARGLPAALASAFAGGDFRQSYVNHWRAFLRSIEQGTDPPCTLEDGRQSLRAIIAAQAASDRQRPVRLTAAADALAFGPPRQGAGT